MALPSPSETASRDADRKGRTDCSWGERGQDREWRLHDQELDGGLDHEIDQKGERERSEALFTGTRGHLSHGVFVDCPSLRFDQ
jgi:hypothetical protein